MPQRDDLDLARVLLARASGDETIVRKAVDDADIDDWVAGFHGQQSTEKLIKAVLAARGVAFAKSHSLRYLIGLVNNNQIDAPEELAEADVLSPWAVEFRYEGEAPPALDRAGSLALVEKLRAWAEHEIETAGASRADGDEVRDTQNDAQNSESERPDAASSQAPGPPGRD
ncbi:MAG TPA: HEPN domain-containing protein [Solirubrobacteraceae bacterium]|nr:HEPN domain-containing protein [Solirubrobacteraceae bacterium]